MKQRSLLQADYANVHGFIKKLLEEARYAVARNVNTMMTACYWEVGRRIFEFEQLGEERATYGEELIKRLAIDLTAQFGRGYSKRNLHQMLLFYQHWPIVQTLSAQSSPHQPEQLPVNFSNTIDLNTLANRFPLPWSAYVRLLAVKNPLARSFYETEALRCGWSVRQLDRQVNSQFYERIALSKNKVAMLSKGEKAEADDIMTPEEVIKDPFVLEFLNLKDEYSESDLEDALIQNLADFLMELGDDFAFIGRQRRLRLDNTWFRVDLLFFHRRLRCLLIADLKIGKFNYADAGQMHL
jgi:predicted nuclease of restriction endonuclease-like (RecB) superfamily